MSIHLALFSSVRRAASPLTHATDKHCKYTLNYIYALKEMLQQLTNLFHETFLFDVATRLQKFSSSLTLKRDKIHDNKCHSVT